jgi:hypothetical protein
MQKRQQFMTGAGPACSKLGVQHWECNGPVSQVSWLRVQCWLGALSRCRRETPAQVASQAVIHNEGQRNSGDGLPATDLRQPLRIASICSLAVIQRCLRTPESRHVRTWVEVMMDERDRRGKRLCVAQFPSERACGAVVGAGMEDGRPIETGDVVRDGNGCSNPRYLRFCFGPNQTEAFRLRSRLQRLLLQRLTLRADDASP